MSSSEMPSGFDPQQPSPETADQEPASQWFETKDGNRFEALSIRNKEHLDRVARLLAQEHEQLEKNAGVWHRATPGVIANAFSEKGRQAIQKAKGLPLEEIRNNEIAVPHSHLHHFIRKDAHDPLIQQLLDQPKSLVVPEGGMFYNVVASDLIIPHPHLTRQRGEGLHTAVIYPYDDEYLEELHDKTSAYIREMYPEKTGVEVFAIQGTSANRHNTPQPLTFEEVDSDILSRAGFIIDANNVLSTVRGPFPIVDLTGKEDYGFMRSGVFAVPEEVTHTLDHLRSQLPPKDMP
jgi:hypothetical protein